MQFNRQSIKKIPQLTKESSVINHIMNKSKYELNEGTHSVQLLGWLLVWGRGPLVCYDWGQGVHGFSGSGISRTRRFVQALWGQPHPCDWPSPVYAAGPRRSETVRTRFASSWAVPHVAVPPPSKTSSAAGHHTCQQPWLESAQIFTNTLWLIFTITKWIWNLINRRLISSDKSAQSNVPDSSDIHCVLCCISHGEVSSIGPFVEKQPPVISEHNEQIMEQTLGVVLQTASTRSICAS